jgi:DNA-binding transcriptional LysR family regulator
MDDLRLLKVLREVALRGSFSAAADALSYSQPAVSQQIARLESQAGVKLIERQPRGLRLTPAGEALVRHTEKILAQLAEAQAELTEIATSARGRLRVGAFATAAGTIVPLAVSEFRRLRPGVKVDLQVIDPPDSIFALRRGDLDLAISEEGGFEDDPDLSGLGVERLMDDVMYALLPAEHPLVTRRAVALPDLQDEEWMLVGLAGTCSHSNIVLRACEQAGFEPRIAYTSDDFFAIQGLVASGMGVALVPALALASTREDVAVRPLRGRPPYRRVGAVFQPDPTGPLAVMLDCLRDAADGYRRAAPMSAVAA